MNDVFKWDEQLIAEFSRIVAQAYKTSDVWSVDLEAEMQLMEAFKRSKELKWYVVPDDALFGGYIKGWTPTKQHEGNMGGYAGAEYFDTEEDAATFVLLNKPVLSLQDIMDATTSPLRDYENKPHFLALKTLAQYKISQK